MRVFFSGLLAAGLLGSQVAAAQTCARPADLSAFDLAGLKTQLMVTALTCKADDRYNEFVTRYRPALLENEKALGSYFNRAHGRRSQQQRDDYITQLANSHMQTGLKQGNRFCDRNMGAFDEVMALRNSSELADFAAGKSHSQPVSLANCGAAEPTQTQARPASTTGTRTASASRRTDAPGSSAQKR